jgi:hypothetical protein
MAGKQAWLGNILTTFIAPFPRAFIAPVFDIRIPMQDTIILMADIHLARAASRAVSLTEGQWGTMLYFLLVLLLALIPAFWPLPIPGCALIMLTEIPFKVIFFVCFLRQGLTMWPR